MRRTRVAGRRMTRALAHILIISVFGSTTLLAQARPTPVAAISTVDVAADAIPVSLLVGRSAVIDVGTPITRVSLTSADVADALVTSPSQLLINGKTPGTISMFVWDRGGSLRRYEVVVQRDLARLGEQMRELFPGEQIAVQSNGKNVVLTGLVSHKDVIEKAISVAAGYVEKRDEVTPLLQLQPGARTPQVLLRVRFAEVSRNALTELGASFFTSPLGVNNTLGRVTTQQYAAPGFDKLQWAKEDLEFGSPVTNASGEFTFSDFLNLFFFNQQYDLGLMVKALQTRGLFQSLAEPNLVAESGKEASFLAGGEFPVPVVQGTGGNTAISIMFKEFGIRLSFTPTVTDGRIQLKVKPEVSTLDFNNAVVLQGFRIPALTTRRTETELELQNGQTFAIAGLMNNTMRSSLQKIPGIGDIPILGLLFQSKAAQKDQTELVVMITPEILPDGSRGVTPNLPRLAEPYLDPLPARRAIEPPPPAFGAQQRSGQSAPVMAAAPAPARQQPSSTQQSAADAAAAVSALTPAAPRIINSTPAAPTSGAAAAPADGAGSGDGASPAANVAGTTPANTRPLTADEKKRIERAQRVERARAKLQ